MRGLANGVVTVGVIVIVFGAVLGITCLSTEHLFFSIMGWLFLIIGVILTVVGIVARADSRAETDYQKPVQPPVYPPQFPSGTIAFCQYCGAPLYGSIVCRVCGRRVQ